MKNSLAKNYGYNRSGFRGEYFTQAPGEQGGVAFSKPFAGAQLGNATQSMLLKPLVTNSSGVAQWVVVVGRANEQMEMSAIIIKRKSCSE